MASEGIETSGDYRWTRLFTESSIPEIRAAVAKALTLSDNEMANLFLVKLADDSDSTTRDISRRALKWAQAEWTWENGWDHEPSGI